jgi:hypothetical protein
MTTEDALRRILAAEAESVGVAHDALSVIRGRIAGRRVHWWHRRLSGMAMLSFTAGTAVVAAAAVALALVTTPTAPRAPQAPAGPGVPPSAAALPQTANLPVYYLGDTSVGVRLFREYHVLAVDGSDAAARTRAALRAMLATHSAADPDYRTPWRDAGVNSARVDGDTALVDLHDVPASPAPDAQTARMAVQQLIWTATAASAAVAVRVTFDGRQRASLWGVPGLDGRLERGPRTDVQAPIWLIDPQQHAVVGQSFEVYIAGTVTGGTVRLRVVPAGGGPALKDEQVPLTAGAPQLGEAHLTVTAPPGRYLVTAYTSRLAGGADLDADSHEITVD